MEKDFYHREEVLISLGMMEHHGKTETEKHGSHAVWFMYIVWESCLGIKQLVAGGGVALIGVTLIPLLSGLLG